MLIHCVLLSFCKQLSTKDLAALEDALDTLGKDKKKLLVEKEELDDLREEMKDYKEVSVHLHVFVVVYLCSGAKFSFVCT